MPADRVGFLEGLVREYGNIVHFRIGFERIYLINEPDLIREVLVTNHKNFRKGRGLERVKRVLGEGLLTSEGQHHLHQRRMMQPSFHREKIAGFARQMSAEAERLMAGWRDGQEVDIAKEMGRLTLRIVGRTLFGSDVDGIADEVSRSLTAMMESFYMLMLPFPALIERLPLPRIRRMMAGRKRLAGIIYGLIDARRKAGAEGDDLLSMLLQAQDTEGDGHRMTDEQVHDEAMTIFLAGHETTANAMAWTWYLLTQNPAVESKLHEEVDRVLQERLPEAADYPALGYVEKVVSESMRVYPPAWLVARRAIAEQKLGGYTLPAQALVMASQWVTHKDARYFADPLRFDPERWTAEFKAGLPKFAYYPFGGGPRQCIGEGFAWMETVLLVAAISQRWRMELLPGQSIVPEPVITLRPREGVRVRLVERIKAEG
ncbi:MAG: cytochrome P450 [Chthoniobacteraceae bacterium]